MFFKLRPQRATLSDINADLINVYIQVRDRWEDLVHHLKGLRISKRQYRVMRRTEPANSLQRAVRFLYLNRTGFSGMYRLNRKGQFNVPYGGGQRTTECLWSERRLENASAALKGLELQTSDFEPMIDRAGRGDVVYCDPTYTVAHENNGFLRYNESNFSWADQERLAEACKRAMERGAVVLASNAWDASVRKLYGVARSRKLERNSLVSRTVEGRRRVHEYLFILGKTTS